MRRTYQHCVGPTRTRRSTRVSHRAETVGGRRVPVSLPRMRAIDGSGELPVPSYELFSSTEVLGWMALERMAASTASPGYRPAVSKTVCFSKDWVTKSNREKQAARHDHRNLRDDR